MPLYNNYIFGYDLMARRVEMVAEAKFCLNVNQSESRIPIHQPLEPVGESIPASLSYLKLNQTEVNSPAIDQHIHALFFFTGDVNGFIQRET